MASWTKREDGQWESDDGLIADLAKARQLEVKAAEKPKENGFRLSDLWNKPSMLPEPVNQALWGFNERLAPILDSILPGNPVGKATVGPQPTNTTGRVARTAGNVGFDTAALLAPQLKAAQMGALAAPVTAETGALARVGKSILDQTRARPGAVAGIEAISGLSGGAGSQAGAEMFPGNPVAPVIGGLLGAGTTASMMSRSLFPPSQIRPRPQAPRPVAQPSIPAPSDIPKSGAIAGAIRKKAGALPENTEPGMVAPERPSVALQREIADAAHDLLTAGGVPRDKNLKLYEQVAELLDSGRLSTPTVKKILEDRGLSPNEFGSALYGKEISQSARELQVLSNLSQRLEKITVDETAAIAGDARSTIQKLDDIRRGLLVSQLGTAVRNATVGVGRSIFETFNRGLEFGLQAMRGKVNPNNPVKTPAQVWSGMARMFTIRDNLDIVKQSLSIRPKLYDTLMRQYSADVAIGATGKMDKAVQALNVFNRTQDQYFRSAVFADSLDRRMSAAGMNMRETLKGGGGAIPKEMSEAAVNDALEFTFSDNVKTQAGTAFVNAIEAFRPLTTTVMPFPRFFANSLRFMSETSPLGPLWLLSKAERAALAAGDNRLIARALVGSALTYSGYAIRDSEYAGEKWYEIKSGDRTIDIRAYYPVAAYMFTGDVIKRANDGTLFNMTAKDLLQGFSGAQVRGGTGLYMVDGFVNEISGDSKAGKKAWNIAKRLAGEYAGGYLLPFQQIKDAYSEYDEQDKILRDVSEQPFAGPILTKLPKASQGFPAAESPTQGRDIIRQDPLFRQFTGVTFAQEKNAAQKEFDRLGYTRTEIFRNTGIPEADRLIMSKMGPLVEEHISRVVQSPLYQSLGAMKNKGGPPAQRYLLDQVLGYIRETAKIQAMQENPVVMGKVKFNSGIDKDLRIMLDRMYGINADSFGEQ